MSKKVLLPFILILSFGLEIEMANAKPVKCFDPFLDPVVQQRLKPMAKYHETTDTIAAIHRLIWEHRTQIDPRLIYYRMFGESDANPEALNKSKDSYGLFQMKGHPRGTFKTHRKLIDESSRQNPLESPRLLQTKYYLEKYLSAAVDAADHGYGCNRRKVFSQYTNFEKLTYLGLGKCSDREILKEKNRCLFNKQYGVAACSVAAPVLSNPPLVPLCETLSESGDANSKVKQGAQ